jgi:formamidopyrimidine-DNA glycosylase
MPELPEVETVRMKLLPSLKGKTIKKVKALYEEKLKAFIEAK